MSTPATSSPDTHRLSVLDGIAFLVGVVVGIGIFGFPPLVAANVNSGTEYMLAWLAGGLVMLVGALTYAELGSTYPSSGGEYHFLSRAFGRRVGLLFAWARGSVIQTGAIAVVAFIYGEYANQLLDLGPYGVSIHAAISVIVLTALNLAGTGQSKRVQILFTIAAIVAVVVVIVAGLAGVGAGRAEAQLTASVAPSAAGSLGMAMVFVLLTYGGWNEAAYLTGEMRDVKRDITRVMLIGTAIVVTLYAAVNLAFLGIFGLEGLRNTGAVGAALMDIVAGPRSAIALSLMVCLTALSTINGTIFTGARVYYALGQDIPALSRLGAAHGSTPVTALVVQAVITLVLIVFGAFSDGSGVETMVAYTAPVFWLFMLLVGISLFVFRRRDPARERPFRVPLYPITPLLFCLTCAGLFYSSLMYAGVGGFLGLLVLATGLPFVVKYGADTPATSKQPAA